MDQGVKTSYKKQKKRQGLLSFEQKTADKDCHLWIVKNKGTAIYLRSAYSFNRISFMRELNSANKLSNIITQTTKKRTCKQMVEVQHTFRA